MKTANRINFILGSNTSSGFRSLFEQLLGADSGVKLFLLKGGPGTGKSSLMKRVGGALTARGDRVEYIPCASDPQSLDGIIDYAAKIAVLDGTAPHTLEPLCPGACESMLQFGDYWDEKLLLKNRQTIVDLSYAISLRHARAGACIAAADALLQKNREIAAKYVDHNAINEFAHSFFRGMESEGAGREKKRLLSAVSVGEMLFYADTLKVLCKKIYAIPDEFGAFSHCLLTQLRATALSLGLDIVTCPCSISTPEKIEHLILPEFGTGFTTCNAFHNAASDTTVPLGPFTKTLPPTVDVPEMRDFAIRAESLIAEAARQVRSAKLLHDDLEQYYEEAMDFTKLESVFTRIMEAVE